ncbi:hypothetical protein D3C86_1416210 [compost metagenome]
MKYDRDIHQNLYADEKWQPPNGLHGFHFRRRHDYLSMKIKQQNVKQVKKGIISEGRKSTSDDTHDDYLVENEDKPA